MVDHDNPVVTQARLLVMQVCVPALWTNDQMLEFAERENPAGTLHGWAVSEDGHPCLAGTPARVTCDDRPTFVHVVLYV